MRFITGMQMKWISQMHKIMAICALLSEQETPHSYWLNNCVRMELWQVDM
jgi:hypothetical protein